MIANETSLRFLGRSFQDEASGIGVPSVAFRSVRTVFETHVVYVMNVLSYHLTIAPLGRFRLQHPKLYHVQKLVDGLGTRVETVDLFNPLSQHGR